MATPPDLSQYLRRAIDALRSVIAACAGRNRAAVPVVLLLWPYLHRLAARFDSLVQRVHAGLPPPRPLGPRTARVKRERPPRLPQKFAWLIRLAPETAPLGSQLRVWLADPEVESLLLAAPQAGRLLRPLCHMLGIEPGPDVPVALFPPPVPRRSAATPIPETPIPDQRQPASPDPENQHPARQATDQPAAGWPTPAKRRARAGPTLWHPPLFRTVPT